MSKSVLCYGKDIMLLHSRKWLLQHAGCPSDYVSDVIQYETELRETLPGVVVLCQTLSPEECSVACKLAVECSSTVRLLLLFVHIQKCFPRQPYNVLESTMGPKLFSQTVFNLLYEL